LQAFQRAQRPFVPGRDGMFLSNTWGDRNRDARINEAFLLQEIDAGARLGVDVVQIDDGWQKGRTANSAAAKGKGVWNGTGPRPGVLDARSATLPPRSRPGGRRRARQRHEVRPVVRPDSSGGVANWQRDAGRILELHRDNGIDYFKIDSVKATSVEAETNLHRFFDRVLRESGGRVVFDLDVTAEIRPGYFGAPRTGPIFVENRYTDFHRYWPHQTLRNLWMLSRVVDPLRLRIEVLNNARKAENYPDDPLAPAKWRPDTLFATTMMANPLGWFEVSNLPADYVAEVAPLVATWKRERARMHGGTILPIGGAPDGAAWTGLASVMPDRRGAHVLAFRELNAGAEWSCTIPLLDGAATPRPPCSAAAGRREMRDGRLTVRVPAPLDFVWVRLDEVK
jgi:alpha-galactosidase